MGGAAAAGSGFFEGSRSMAYTEHRFILAQMYGPQIAHGHLKEEVSSPLARAQRVKEGGRQFRSRASEKCLLLLKSA